MKNLDGLRDGSRARSEYAMSAGGGRTKQRDVGRPVLVYRPNVKCAAHELVLRDDGTCGRGRELAAKSEAAHA